MKNLKSVLEEFHKKYDFSENKTLEYDNLMTIPDFFTASLISLLEECVPEESVEDHYLDGISYDKSGNEVGSFNACRQKLLDNIETITKL